MNYNLILLTACCLLSPYACAEFDAKHSVFAGISEKDFTWQEFDRDDGREILKENGKIITPIIGYGYTRDQKSLFISYTQGSSTVDYLGEKKFGSSGEKLPTTVSYNIDNIEAEFGSKFAVDYINPYASIYGGYHSRDRDIKPFAGTGQGLDERISYLYWGLKLEAELLKWNSISLHAGGTYSRSVKTKNRIIEYTQETSRAIDSELDIPLKALIGHAFHARIQYEFLEGWSASFGLMRHTTKMDRSDVVRIDISDITGVPSAIDRYQPESKEMIDSFDLVLSKFFR